MFTVIVALALVAAPAQSPAEDAQRLFEAGQFSQVVALAGAEATPDVIYMAAQGSQRLGAPAEAAALYDRLIARPDADPWHAIGLSARQLLDNQLDPALASARQAVMLAGLLAETHYQLGLVQARRQAWAEAAAAFDQATELAPRMAYAYYYGGLMHSRARQPAQMAVRFEQFLRLAPEAQERPEVVQIMRTWRR